jgi:hypothetical protein
VANAVDMNLRAALGKDYDLLAKQEAPRRERYRCHGCGVFMSEVKFWSGACSRCGADNRP